MSQAETTTSKVAAVAGPAEQDFILSSLPPSAAQKRLALGMVLVMMAAFVVAGLLSRVQLRRIDPFTLGCGAAMFVNDSITSVLLFAQFSILRSRALLAISCGYLFTALMLIPWGLAFPGVFAPSGVVGGLQTTPTAYLLWHAGFSAFVIAYALLKSSVARLRHASVRRAILAGVGMTATLVCALSILVIAGHDWLPRIMVDQITFTATWDVEAGIALLISVAALVVLWARRRSVLDLYLMVVMCAFVIEIALISFPVAKRFTIGWYTGRVFGVLAGSITLFVLLYETTTLYAQLLRAVMAQRRERDARLMTGDAVAASIAHEVNQPLTAMITNADAGLRWMDGATPDLAEAHLAFERIAAAGHRAAALIESTRAIFRKDVPNRTLLDINDLIWEALALLRDELQLHRVSVRTEPNEPLPWVKGDHVQLQQVLVNLITNAIESMAREDGTRLLCVKSRVEDSGGVTVAVEDTGGGLERNDLDRVFDPLFTTKPRGMGMGLSICRSIIEAHEGRLWATPSGSRGAVFQFTLPASTGRPAD
jgi:signal transduction histidine kinase